jgi:hypothetical protein
VVPFFLYRRGLSIALSLVLVGLLVSGIGPTPARADLSLSVMPGLIDLEAMPGARGSQEIVISNPGTEAFTASVVIEPIASAPAERTAVGWLTASTDFVELEPGEQEVVTIGIAVPDWVDSGGYYAKVSFTTLNEEAGANSAALAGQLGVGLMLTIDGDGELVREGRIVQLAPVLEADGRVGFRMRVTNDGDTHLIAPAGAVVVTHADGSPLGSLDFPESTPLLPGAESTLVTQGSLPLTRDGDYLADATFTFQDGSEEGATISASTSFTVAPALSLAPTQVCENLDRGPSLTVAVQNDGNLGLQPLITVTLESAATGAMGTSPIMNGQILWPGEDQLVTVDFPERLVSGSYRLITTVQFDPTAEPLVQETPFQIGGLEGSPVPLCSELPA